MAHQRPEDDGPSLELPSLFGRRRRGHASEPPMRSTTTPAEEPSAPPPPPLPPEEPTDPDGPDCGARSLTLPAWASSTAALVVGAAVGVLGCLLTWVGLQGCELVTGTDSCGGPGLLVLVVILVGMVLAGAAALRLFGVPGAGSVSSLGVGLLTTVALLLLTDHLDAPWMLVVVPVLTALCYAIAHWVLTRSVDEADLEPARREPYDVR